MTIFVLFCFVYFIAVFGGILGTLGGALVVTFLKLSGTTIEELRNFQHTYIKSRDEAFHAMHRKQLEEEDLLLEAYHKVDRPIDYTLNWLDKFPEEKLADNKTDRQNVNNTKLNASNKNN